MVNSLPYQELQQTLKDNEKNTTRTGRKTGEIMNKLGPPHVEKI